MRAGFTTDINFASLVLPLIVQGIAMSVFFVSMLTILLHGIPAEKLPAASGLSNFARITAGGFAASLTTVIWDRREALHQTRLSESSSPLNPLMAQAMSRLHADGLSAAQSLGVLGQNLINQSYMLATNDFFWISGCVCLGVLPLVWFTKKAVSDGSHAGAD